MASDLWRRYNKFPEYMGDGTIDMDTDTFNMALYLSTSDCATLTETTYPSTNEHASANGYTTKGSPLASVTWVEAAGTITFDSADVVFTAAAGSIVARFAQIFSDTAAGDQLVAYNLMDNAPADMTATDTNTLTIAMNASGILTVSGGQAAS